MKRFLSILMVALLTVSLAACANGTEDTTGTTATPTTNIEAESVTTVATTTKVAQTTATTTTVANTQAPVNQVTTEKKTEWKPVIYTTAAATTAKRNEYAMSALAMDKKKVGDTMKSPLSSSTYTLKWMDDFNGTKVNTADWTIMTENANASEGQVNKPENVKVANGKLSISLKKETATTPDNFTKKFTGGGIQSKGKKYFKYGRIEALMKVPYGKGMWPAFWTIGDTIAGGREAWWPWGGEIDIMEMFGKSNTQTVMSGGIFYYPPKDYENFDYNNAKSLLRESDAGSFRYPATKFSDGYHVFGIEWTPLKLTFYFDNHAWGTIDITGEDFEYAMHNAHQIIIHYAVEGFGLQADGTRAYDGREPGSDAVIPQTFDIDWVKVWQK
ncbi:MAG: glycoside hydrolase family 16 protein [Clostridia bacterium]|nr:glycoside hydrolase family 16 protein [Clostridia bacterium]